MIHRPVPAPLEAFMSHIEDNDGALVATNDWWQTEGRHCAQLHVRCAEVHGFVRLYGHGESWGAAVEMMRREWEAR